MGHHVALVISRVDGGFEDFHALAGELGPFQPSYQFFCLAGKHGSADDFDSPSAHPFPLAFVDWSHNGGCMFVDVFLAKISIKRG